MLLHPLRTRLQTPSRLLTKRFWLGAALLSILILGMITGFQPLYWLFYVAVGSILVGYLWIWLQSRGLETHIQEISSHSQMGHAVRLRVEIREKLGLPRLGLQAHVAGDILSSHEEDFNLSPHASETWTVSGVCDRRGLNSVGPVTLSTSDPSGLLSLERRIGRSQSILVYPNTIDLLGAAVQGQGVGGEVGHTGQLRGNSPTASLVRQFVPGDSLTHIHWPTTARRDQLMTKEFEGTGTNDIWIYVDLQESSQVRYETERTEEYSITIAASIVKGLIRLGHSVGLVMHGESLQKIPPDRNTEHLWTILRVLALAQPKGQVSLHSLLAGEIGNLEPGNVAIIVAPWPDRSFEDLFQLLLRRGIVVVPIFLERSGFAQALEGRPTKFAHSKMQEWAFVINRGDDLSTALDSIMNRITAS